MPLDYITIPPLHWPQLTQYAAAASCRRRKSFAAACARLYNGHSGFTPSKRGKTSHWKKKFSSKEKKSLLATQKNRRSWCCDSCAALRWTLENCLKRIGREISCCIAKKVQRVGNKFFSLRNTCKWCSAVVAPSAHHAYPAVWQRCAESCVVRGTCRGTRDEEKNVAAVVHGPWISNCEKFSFTFSSQVFANPDDSSIVREQLKTAVLAPQ